MGKDVVIFLAHFLAPQIATTHKFTETSNAWETLTILMIHVGYKYVLVHQIYKIISHEHVNYV